MAFSKAGRVCSKWNIRYVSYDQLHFTSRVVLHTSTQAKERQQINEVLGGPCTVPRTVQGGPLMINEVLGGLCTVPRTVQGGPLMINEVLGGPCTVPRTVQGGPLMINEVLGGPCTVPRTVQGGPLMINEVLGGPCTVPRTVQGDHLWCCTSKLTAYNCIVKRQAKCNLYLLPRIYRYPMSTSLA